MFIIFGVVFWSVITVLIYFSLVGIGLLTSLTVWHDYDIYTGCLHNQTTCNRPLFCRTNNLYSIYGSCMLQGIASVFALVVGGTLIIACCWLIYNVGLEFKQAYIRTKKRYEYEEVSAV